MNVKIIAAALMLLCAFSSYSQEQSQIKSNIPLIGLDQNGDEIEMPLQGGIFKRNIKNIINAVNSEVLPSLNHADNASEHSKFKLKKIEVGLSVAASLGLGDVIKASAEPKFILVYKKINN